jgi:hypothetical protein
MNVHMHIEEDPMTDSEFGRTLPGWRTAAIIAAWFAAILFGNATGFFIAAPAAPPYALLAALVGPPLLFALAYRASPGFAAFVQSLDLRLLTALQGLRVLGGSFLALHAVGRLPGLFAYPAGYGDVLVGVLAPFALIALVERRPGWRARVVGLNLLGLIDFVGAVGTGLLASSGPLGLLQGDVTTEPLRLLPISLIPTFLVPLWIIIHVASLVQLRRLNALARWPAAAAAD